MIDLRPHQADDLRKILAAIEDGKSVLYAAPTGTGKTRVMSAAIKAMPNRHIIVVTHLRQLVLQAYKDFRSHGISAGMIMAGEQANHVSRVQVISLPTFRARFRDGDKPLPPASLIFIDECHHVPAASYQWLFERFPGVVKFGVTATPIRRDGRGFGNDFDVTIESLQVRQQIDLGYLVPTKVFAPVMDLDGIHSRLGDFVETELADRLNTTSLVGNVVSDYCRYGEGRRSVLFAINRAHARNLEIEFNKIGVRCEYLDGSTPQDERDAIFARLASGETRVVSTCEAISEGWNVPEVSCCILAKPTRSPGVYIQKVGRVLRPWLEGGKTDAIVIDHANATRMHGRIEDEIDWPPLHSDRKAINLTQAAHDQRQHGDRLIDCRECGAIRTAGQPCGNCGYYPKAPPKEISFDRGELALLEANGRQGSGLRSEQERKRFYQGLLHLVICRGQKRGAAAYRYKDKFGDWPARSWSYADPLPPTAEVAAWDRHCRIKFAKSMQKAAASV